MEFDSNIVTEITAPNTVAFVPGNNIIGIGADVPPELTAVGFEAAIIMYSTDWDPLATTPKVKYWGIVSVAGAIQYVYCASVNPSTTPATLQGGFQMGGRTVTLVRPTFAVFDDIVSTAVIQLVTIGTGAGTTGGALDMRASNAAPSTQAGRGKLYVNAAGALVYRGPTTSTTVAPA